MEEHPVFARRGTLAFGQLGQEARFENYGAAQPGAPETGEGRTKLLDNIVLRYNMYRS